MARVPVGVVVHLYPNIEDRQVVKGNALHSARERQLILSCDKISSYNLAFCKHELLGGTSQFKFEILNCVPNILNLKNFLLFKLSPNPLHIQY